MASKKDVAGEVAKGASAAAATGKKTVKAAADTVAITAAKGTKAAKGAVDVVKATATKGASAVKGAATKAATKGAEAAKGAATTAKAAASTTAAKGTKAVKDVAGGAVATAAKGKKAALGALGAVGGALGGIAAKAGDVAGDALDTAKGAAKGVVDKVGDVAEGAIDKVQDLAGDAVDVAKDAAQNVVGAAGDAVEGAVDLAQDALGKVGSVGAGALGAGAAAIGGVAALAGNAAKGAADVANDGVEAAKDAVAGITGEKKDGFLVPLLLLLGIAALAWFGFNHFANKAGAPAAATSQMAAPAWLTAIGDKLKSQFAWLTLGHNGGAVVASGEAADKNAKDAALAAIAMEVEASEGKGANVIDNITIAGSTETPVGAALAALGANPDVTACSKAFTDTMNGRTINFASGAAAVSDDSASLLNALTGIANACSAHKVEIAGHTDSTGEDAANLTLSQSRADAVKAFWVSKGVKADGLTAKGYGETKPLEAGETEAAHAKNRRTEFMVSAAQ